MSGAFSMYISHLTTRNPKAETIHGRLPACFINLKKKKTHVRMLFTDYSLAFIPIEPSKFVIELRDIRLNTVLCDWTLNFLVGRPQAVRLGNTTFSTLVALRAACSAPSFVSCSRMTA